MNEIMAVALITLLAVVSPGADFAIVSKNSYLYGRQVGLLTAAGIALGVLVHVGYALAVSHWVIVQSPNLLVWLRYVGAGYLLYFGYHTVVAAPIQLSLRPTAMTAWQAFATGWLTNVFNPKTALFVLSMVTQIAQPNALWWPLLGFGLFVALTHGLWFALVATALSAPPLRQRLLANQTRINQGIGALLMVLGLALLFMSPR